MVEEDLLLLIVVCAGVMVCVRVWVCGGGFIVVDCSVCRSGGAGVCRTGGGYSIGDIVGGGGWDAMMIRILA